MTDPHVLISGYLDGLLDEQAIEELNDWINADKANARYFAQMCFIHRRVHDVMHGDEVTSLMDVFKSAEDGLAHAADSEGSGVDFEVLSREDLLREVIDQERAAAARRTVEEAERKASEMLERSIREESLKSMMERSKANQSQTRHYVIPKPLFYGGIAAVVAVLALLFWPNKASMPTVGDPNPSTLVDVAVVVEQVDAVWDNGDREISIGHSIRNEPIALSHGFARLRFASGAEVILEAPCIFKPVSPLKMEFQRGELWARCETPSSKGFTIESKNARIVDIGTEFGVSLSEDGVLDAHVLDGSVEFAAVTADGVRPSTTLSAGQARRVSADGESVTELKANRYHFVRGMTAAERDRVAGYVHAVRSLKPAVYYRFESINGRDVLENEMGAKYRARLIDDVRLERTGAGMAGRFAGGYVQLLRTITELSDQPRYSMECWVKPNEVKRGAVLTMLADTEDPTDIRGLGGLVLQAPVETIRPERSGRVRFSHRNPPRASYGTEVLQPQLYEADRWMHIVAVKTETTLSLYINGHLASAVDDATTWAEDEFVTRIGINVASTDIQEQRRPFDGLIDEVAIYDRALSEEQIREHYERLIVLLED